MEELFSIRPYAACDLERIVEIWLSGNREAHPFIPESYWVGHCDEVCKQLPQAEVYVCTRAETPVGFIGIQDGYIAGLFVAAGARSKGIGKQLLAFCRKRYGELWLQVYCKNERAVLFYLREGFSVISRQLDADTGEMEYSMRWRRAPG